MSSGSTRSQMASRTARYSWSAAPWLSSWTLRCAPSLSVASERSLAQQHLVVAPVGDVAEKISAARAPSAGEKRFCRMVLACVQGRHGQRDGVVLLPCSAGSCCRRFCDSWAVEIAGAVQRRGCWPVRCVTAAGGRSGQRRLMPGTAPAPTALPERWWAARQRRVDGVGHALSGSCCFSRASRRTAASRAGCGGQSARAVRGCGGRQTAPSAHRTRSAAAGAKRCKA